MKQPSLSIFLPMYNEETNVGEILPKLQTVLREITEDYEIVAIDDGSRDRTVERVRSFAAGDPRIRLVQHEVNRGYGAALRTGFQSVTKEIVAYTDADLPVDLEILKVVVPRMESTPVLIGSRSQHETLKRGLFGTIYRLTLRILFGLRVRDVNFAFKLFRKEVVDQFKARLRSGSVFIDGEVLVLIHRMGIPIVEVPMTYRFRQHGVSTLGSWKQAFFTFREILEFFLKTGCWKETDGRQKKATDDR
ncbi:MAG: glycosyltransferase family 2 protein [Pseudomonadota bacterium]